MADKVPLPQQIVAALNAKKINANCPCCNANNWTVLDKIVSVPIVDAEGSFRIPPPFVPAGGLVCNNCGFMKLHALPVLNIGPRPIEEKK